MKPYYFLILSAALLVFSCKNDTPESTSQTGLADSLHTENDEALADEMVDSVIFHIGNHEFETSESTANDFNAVADPFKMKDTSEANRIQKVSFVVRNGDSLIFKCSNTTAFMINNPNDDDDNYAQYTFIQDMPQINQWLVMGSYYESYGYVFIDKTSGDSTMLYGMPVVSPDNKYIVTFNQDLQAGFTFNGFQLFEIKNSKPIALGEKMLNNWGPDNVRWKDATTLLVELSRYRPDHADPEEAITTEFIQMKMK